MCIQCLFQNLDNNKNVSPKCTFVLFYLYVETRNIDICLQINVVFAVLVEQDRPTKYMYVCSTAFIVFVVCVMTWHWHKQRTRIQVKIVVV